MCVFMNVGLFNTSNFYFLRGNFIYGGGLILTRYITTQQHRTRKHVQYNRLDAIIGHIQTQIKMSRVEEFDGWWHKTRSCSLRLCMPEIYVSLRQEGKGVVLVQDLSPCVRSKAICSPYCICSFAFVQILQHPWLRLGPNNTSANISSKHRFLWHYRLTVIIMQLLFHAIVLSLAEKATEYLHDFKWKCVSFVCNIFQEFSHLEAKVLTHYW